MPTALTRSEILALTEREKVKFLRLQFTDILGVIKNVEVPDRQFGEALDGHEREWQRRIGYVSQDVYLLDETLRRNIAFGVPGAAINPFYAALRKVGGVDHVLARHVEGASHRAEGYTRTKAGNIGVCIGTSGPAGTDMITGLYSAWADSIPILCITGQAPRARLYKEDFQAVDIESIAKPVTKWAVTVREPALVPRVFQQAFHLMRSGRPGPVLIDLPFDVQVAEIEFDIDTYSPMPVYKPAATRAQAERAIEMLCEAERPLLVCGGGAFNAHLMQRLAAAAGPQVVVRSTAAEGVPPVSAVDLLTKVTGVATAAELRALMRIPLT